MNEASDISKASDTSELSTRNELLIQDESLKELEPPDDLNVTMRQESNDRTKKQPKEPFARAANEDDDGYDPWSDRPVKESFWEEDPWR